MARLCEGRVAIVTGGARGVGREHCLMLAEHGAKVVVNDVGVTLSGDDDGVDPAAEVCAEIEAIGSQAVPNHDSVTDFEGAQIGRLAGETVVDGGDGHAGRCGRSQADISQGRRSR